MKLTKGQRSGGFHEVQLLTILLQNTNNLNELTGWLRLSFKGFTHWSPWFRTSASNTEIEGAINEMNTIRPVKVTRVLVNGTYSTGMGYTGYQWQIQFIGDLWLHLLFCQI